jgi:sec-independent protein translocase protein TatB
MFDIGFSELMVIAVVALIVIGPERLPKVARTLGHLFGRMQRYVNDVKADISREMELDELKKLQTTIQDAARGFEESVTREVNTAETELQKIAQEANPIPLPAQATAPDSAVLPAPEAAGMAADTASEPTPQMDLDLGSSQPARKSA